MKNARCLPVILLVFCAAPLLRAGDEDLAPRRTQAEALLQAMHTPQVLGTAAGRVHQMVDAYADQAASTQASATPEQKDAMKHAREEANAIVDKQLGWDAVKGDFIQAYAEAFTEDELKGLVSFYSSPLGQQLIEKQPAVTEKMGKLTQQKMLAARPTIMQKIKDAMPKPAASAAPSTPTSAPTPAPAAAPTAGAS